MTQIFDFELDFAGSLRCIPMVVRLNLDLAGVKLSLRQWSRFTLEDRQRLVAAPCGTVAEIAAYKVFLIALIAERAGEDAVELTPIVDAAWDGTQTPKPVLDVAQSLGLPPPNDRDWSRLSRLQRFSLIKLTRPGHDNDNFGPAMREFGLLSVSAPAF